MIPARIRFIPRGVWENVTNPSVKASTPLGVLKILVRRRWAIGDVLLATGILPGLAAKHPNCRIDFHTVYPAVLRCNPYVTRARGWPFPASAGNAGPFDHEYDRVVDLDDVYERAQQDSILRVYCRAAAIEERTFKTFIHARACRLPLPDEYVVLHPKTYFPNWMGRSWGEDKFQELGSRMVASGLKVVVIGDKREKAIHGAINYQNRLSLAETAHVIQHARLFVGTDSVPMHLAQCFDVPGVAFFGSVLPKNRIYRASMEGVNAAGLNCLGCHHERFSSSFAQNKRFCRRGDNICQDLVTVDLMWVRIQDRLSAAAGSSR